MTDIHDVLLRRQREIRDPPRCVRSLGSPAYATTARPGSDLGSGGARRRGGRGVDRRSRVRSPWVPSGHPAHHAGQRVGTSRRVEGARGRRGAGRPDRFVHACVRPRPNRPRVSANVPGASLFARVDRRGRLIEQRPLVRCGRSDGVHGIRMAVGVPSGLRRVRGVVRPDVDVLEHAVRALQQRRRRRWHRLRPSVLRGSLRVPRGVHGVLSAAVARAHVRQPVRSGCRKRFRLRAERPRAAGVPGGLPARRRSLPAGVEHAHRFPRRSPRTPMDGSTRFAARTRSWPTTQPPAAVRMPTSRHLARSGRQFVRRLRLAGVRRDR